MGRGVFHVSTWLSLSLGFAASNGCTATDQAGPAGPDDDGQHGRLEQGIINGQEVTSNDHGVVTVTTAAGLCTGTMITNYWVLTAKHCIEGVAQTGATVTLDDLQSASEAIASQAIVKHPSQDVALIVLSSAMPINDQSSGFALPIYAGSNASLLPQTLDCWGFGLDTFTEGAGTLRHALFKPDSATTTEVRYRPNFGGQIQWRGDSGSTCFTTVGELRATGVTSFGTFSGSEVLMATQVGPEAYRSWLLSLPFNQSPPLVADFDGDHRSDLVFAWDGDPGLILQTAKLAPGAASPRSIDRLPDGLPIWNQGPPLVGDFNGDGRDDIAFAWLSSDGAQIRTKMSNGDGTYTAFTQQFSDGAELWNKGQPMVGDIDNDGRDDIIFAWYAGDGKGLRIYTKRSNGNGTYASINQNFTDGDGIWNQGPPLVGDFDGDGRADLAFAFRSGGKLVIRTKLSNGDGTYTAFSQQFADGANLWNKGRPLVGDVNGDGRDDIIFAWLADDIAALEVRAKLSSGDGTYTAITQQFDDPEDIWNKGQPLIGDVNRDGRADLVFAWYAGDGVGLQIRTKLGTALGLWLTQPAQQLTDGDFIWNHGGPRLTDSDGDGRADLVFATEHTGRVFIRVKRSLGNGQYTASQANL